MPDCIFCAIIDGDAPAHRIYEDEHTLAFLDINPATEGHTVVVPKQHSADLWDITMADARHVMATCREVGQMLRLALRPDGMNLVHASGEAAFQTVPHFHVHVVPRYEDDGIEMPWEPQPADAEELADLAQTILDSGSS